MLTARTMRTTLQGYLLVRYRALPHIHSHAFDSSKCGITISNLNEEKELKIADDWTGLRSVYTNKLSAYLAKHMLHT